MLIKILFIILIGLSAGGVTATGLFALISSIGLINRYADVTNTTESIMLYEEMIIFGAGIGNIWYIFELPIKLGRCYIVWCGIWNIYRYIFNMSCRNSQGTAYISTQG